MSHVFLPLTPAQAAWLADGLKIARVHAPEFLDEQLRVVEGKLHAARAIAQMDAIDTTVKK